MLSVPYKLAFRSLANRIKSVFDQFVSKIQTGFINGRSIGDSTWLIYDIIHHTEKHNLDGLLMTIDFEKAFNSLSWQFLYKTLEIFKFGKSFINWIKIINQDVTAYIMQCGTLSEPISI